jgi:cytoskeletal protein CcmA (bactofilin family)
MSSAPAPQKAIVGEINTLLGRGSEFEGKLTFEGTVRIDGKLSGEVFSDDVLVVGEGAVVQAEVDVGEIIVQGTVIGNVRARRGVEIHAPGRVKGDITTPTLQIDKGVVFEGRCFMEGVADKLRATGGTGSNGPRPANSGPTAVPPAPAPMQAQGGQPQGKPPIAPVK